MLDHNVERCYTVTLLGGATLLILLLPPVVVFMETHIPNGNYRTITFILLYMACLYLICSLVVEEIDTD